MGLTESKPAETTLLKTTNNIIELYQQKTDDMWMQNTLMLQYIAVLESKTKSDVVLTNPVHGWIILTERADGSSVKELLIRDWDAVFFMNGNTVDIRLNNGKSVPDTPPIEINIIHGEKLFNAFIKWRDAECARFAAHSAFFSYMKTDDKC